MSRPTFVAPSLDLGAFTCPNCHTFAQQTRFQSARAAPLHVANLTTFEDVRMSVCTLCHHTAIWWDGKLIHPILSAAPPPNEDMPDEVRRVYIEAANVSPHSSRAAAALLRLGAEMLCKELAPAKDFDASIAVLVGKGLRDDVVRALDIVRVVGNHSVHPGTINVDDEPEIVPALFALLNLIVEQVLTERRQIDGLYGLIPETTLKAIEARNVKALPPAES